MQQPVNPKDLRIGNWVNFDGKPKQITPHDLVYLDEYGAEYKDMYSYIPLTPEIFTEKHGFIWSESIGHWVINWGTNGVYFIKKATYYTGYSFQLGDHYYKLLHYLHQLQNLFHALSETELNINL